MDVVRLAFHHHNDTKFEPSIAVIFSSFLIWYKNTDDATERTYTENGLKQKQKGDFQLIEGEREKQKK